MAKCKLHIYLQHIKSQLGSLFQIPDTSRRSSAAPSSIGSNFSDMMTEETIDLNTSASVVMATPAPAAASNVFFEPGEITGRSTLCRNEQQRSAVSKNARKMSVAEILRSSFVEKARLQFPKQLEQNLQGMANMTNSSIQSESFSCSRSFPHTADMSNLTLNGGLGISFASATAQGFDESFAPAEMMQSKLLMGEISWAQEFAATVPTAALSKQALEKIAAPQTTEIETSVSK